MQAPEIEGATVVMIGSFNPAIFQPRWLGAQGLIRPEEAADAKIGIIQAELADFSTEWFHLQVVNNRFHLVSADPRQYPPLRDLAAAIFSILPHTPVTMLGLSRHFHFKMQSVDSWHAIGHLLAPKEPWSAIMNGPGLRSMLMEGCRKADDGGTLRIKVEPSTRVSFGVYVEVNEEFKAPPEGESEGARWVPDYLADHWESVLDFSETAAEHILSLVRS